MKNNLTNNEKQAIRVLNYIAKYDGIIENDFDIKYLLQQGMDKFISNKRKHLITISENSYPISIKYKKIKTCETITNNSK